MPVRVQKRLPNAHCKKSGRLRLAAIGGSRPREHPVLKRKISVGSADDNDIVISDSTVSRHHALLKRRLRHYRLIDLESTNGTLINGRPINGPTRITRGDELSFGAVRFVFLESPTTRELGKRISPLTALALLALIFAFGFGATQYFVNLSLFRGLMAASSGEFAALANLKSEHHRSKALFEKERAEESQPLWLRRVNYYRALAKLPRVSEDPTLSQADVLHSRYLVKFELRTGSLPFEHTEDPNAPYYTVQGLKAAEHSDIAEQKGALISSVQAVDGWMNGPFHRMAILNPDALKAGLGSFTQDGFEAIALYLQVPPLPPHRFSRAVEFPPPDSIVPLAIYPGGEWPDPLTSCPGYRAPTGLPVTLQLGAWLPVRVTAHSFSHNGTQLANCVFDAATYVNPDAKTQNWARRGLRGSSAVVLIPRAPLASGKRYHVSITASGHTYAWSFTVKQ